MSRATAPAGPLRTALATIPILAILVLVVVQGTGVMLHGQLLRAGESLFPGYSELRNDPEPPTCDPETIGRTESDTAGDPEGDAFLDDLFEEEAAPAAADGGGEGDFLDDLFGDESIGPSEAAIAAARQNCLATHAAYGDRVSRITGGVRAFRTLETSVASLVRWGNDHVRHILVLVILICGVVATGLRAHIALRPIRSVRDDRVSQTGQLLANVGLLFSSIIKYRIDQGSGLDIQHASLPILWMIGFGAMAMMNVRHLFKPLEDAEPGSGVGRPLLTIPLYTIMALSAVIHFFVIEQHLAGPAIYLQKLTENAKLYVQVGLYVWTGMILKRTRIARLFFDVVRPWKLPPELLAPLVVAGAAIPTAYSGASGIFVIAAGAVIYDELRRAGARRQLAIAATAMSGSLGVVLSPCLLVVVVAALNLEVTTGELYHWGWRVYGLSVVIFLIACIVSKREKFPSWLTGKLIRGAVTALIVVAGYLLVSFVAVALYRGLSDVPDDAIVGLLKLCVVLLFASLIVARVVGLGRAVVVLIAGVMVAFYLGVSGKGLEGMRDSFVGWVELFGLLILVFLAKSITLRPLKPYFYISAAVLGFYALALGTRLNEHTAPIILPILMLVLLFYDRRAARRASQHVEDAETESDEAVSRTDDDDIPAGFSIASIRSTDEATAHCGALLMLMGLSMSVGGVIERSNIMSAVPETFGSVWLAMGFLVLLLVFIGMIMDPYGAVILVSVTLAPIASNNGINPLHFWMVVLAAFELGYLTPPVALNQLLTRQVIRHEPEAEAEDAREPTFWRRYEGTLLPLTVMAFRLLIVGLVPLLYY